MAGKIALPPPRAADAASEAAEILRVWIVNQDELATVFPPDLYGEDVWKWGRLLANLARYVANAHAEAHGVPETEALEAIATNFDEEVRRGSPPAGIVTGNR